MLERARRRSRMLACRSSVAPDGELVVLRFAPAGDGIAVATSSADSSVGGSSTKLM
jgi:hypothetical protein